MANAPSYPLLRSGPLASLEALVTTLLPSFTDNEVSEAYKNDSPVRDESSADSSLLPTLRQPSRNDTTSYWNYDLSSKDSQYIETLAMTIQTKLDSFDRLQLVLLLYLLSNPIGTFIIFVNLR